VEFVAVFFGLAKQLLATMPKSIPMAIPIPIPIVRFPGVVALPGCGHRLLCGTCATASRRTSLRMREV